MKKWEELDTETDIVFGIAQDDSGKIYINCSYHGLKPDIRYYTFSLIGLKVMKKVIDLAIKEIEPKKRKRKKSKHG